MFSKGKQLSSRPVDQTNYFLQPHLQEHRIFGKIPRLFQWKLIMPLLLLTLTVTAQKMMRKTIITAPRKTKGSIGRQPWPWPQHFLT
jgi:hypothetical protein